MAYRVTAPASPGETVPRSVRVPTAFARAGAIARYPTVRVSVPLGSQAGTGSGGGTQLNRGLN